MRWNLKDGPRITQRLRNGVLVHSFADRDARFAQHAEIAGDPAKPAELLGCLSEPDPGFAIVTP